MGVLAVVAAASVAGWGMMPPEDGGRERRFHNITTGQWVLRLRSVRNPGGVALYAPGGMLIGKLTDPGDEIPLPGHINLIARYMSGPDLSFSLVNRGRTGGVLIRVGEDLSLSLSGGDPAAWGQVLDLGELAKGNLRVIRSAWP
ncbi:MAG TPA: hypothetical protein VK188_06535 [Holophaga sp.]|nr:hypothetical protein [Holophaga sp.]